MMKANPRVFRILTNGTDGLEKFLLHLEEIGKLASNPPGFTNFKKVISGLKTKQEKFLRGELFRLRACDEVGWGNIRSLEETINGGDRYMDIVKQDGLWIETKYYASLVDKKVSEINIYLIQIYKDISSGKTFEHWLSKTNTITSETQLHQEIKDILTNPIYTSNKNGQNFIWSSQVGANTPFATLDEFISSKFKFKDFNAN